MPQGLSDTIISTLKTVLPADCDYIALHEPVFEGNEHAYVKKCLDTGWVSYAGEFVQEFDRKLAEYCGVKHAVCMSSGTAALHMALHVAGVGDGDEVLIPAMTFVATANAVSYCGAVPHFVDSDEDSLGLDAGKLKDYLATIADKDGQGNLVNKETGQRIAAIVPVHVFGHPCDMDALQSLADDYNLPVISDAAESLGSLYKDKQAASYGLLSTLSFNGNKTITTGGGGAVLTDDGDLALKLRHITTTAKASKPYRFYHDEVGYNYRMPNINAALGCAQLERLDEFLVQKRTLAVKYEEAFEKVDGVRFLKEPSYAKSNYWLNTLVLDDPNLMDMPSFFEATQKAGIMTRPVWDLMHTLPMYRDCPKASLETAENLVKRLINLPSSAFLTT